MTATADNSMPVEGLATIFDLSFTRFVTINIVKFVFILMVAFQVLTALTMIIGGFVTSASAGLGALIIAPVWLVVAVIMTRVWLEIVVVIFRIAENTSKLVALQGGVPAGEVVEAEQQEPQ